MKKEKKKPGTFLLNYIEYYLFNLSEIILLFRYIMFLAIPDSPGKRGIYFTNIIYELIILGAQVL